MAFLFSVYRRYFVARCSTVFQRLSCWNEMESSTALQPTAFSRVCHIRALVRRALSSNSFSASRNSCNIFCSRWLRGGWSDFLSSWADFDFSEFPRAPSRREPAFAYTDFVGVKEEEVQLDLEKTRSGAPAISGLDGPAACSADRIGVLRRALEKYFRMLNKPSQESVGRYSNVGRSGGGLGPRRSTLQSALHEESAGCQ